MHIDSIDFVAGKYKGYISEKFNNPFFLDKIKNIKSLLKEKNTEIISKGRNSIYKCELNDNEKKIKIAVKVFGRQNYLKNLISSIKGSKAKRTWVNAFHLYKNKVGVPEPVAFFEYKKNKRIIESYYIDIFFDNNVSFRDELINIYKNEPYVEKLIELLEIVSKNIYKMHRSGFVHMDLGNQNILLNKDETNNWSEVKFIDLNRGKIFQNLSNKQKARDISRIKLPSEFLRFFIEMYFGGNIIPPKEFIKYERKYRNRFAFHEFTRQLRHPIREYYINDDNPYPPEEDIWIWDKKSIQASIVLNSRDRRKYQSKKDLFIILKTLIKYGFSVYLNYKKLIALSYKKRINMKDRVCIVLSLSGTDYQKELDFLYEVGKVPVLLRFYSHENEEDWNRSINIVEILKNKGYKVSIALIQCRKSVKDLKYWYYFVNYILSKVKNLVDYVEIGHAINRVKWGFWNLNEHKKLLHSIKDLFEKYKELKFIGPACIDFEFHTILPALENFPENVFLEGLSHHLYVDRRGAPENYQGSFNTLKKVLFARAINKSFKKSKDSFIISEVNWPIKDTGVYSPTKSPYISPGPWLNEPSIDEENYSNYMIRYFLICICSSGADKVYWWSLLSKGFGLIDYEEQNNKYRKRKAYNSFKYFIKVMENSFFIKKEKVESINYYFFENDDYCFNILYTENNIKYIDMEEDCVFIKNIVGENIIKFKDEKIKISEEPVYLFYKK